MKVLKVNMVDYETSIKDHLENLGYVGYDYVLVSVDKSTGHNEFSNFLFKITNNSIDYRQYEYIELIEVDENE